MVARFKSAVSPPAWIIHRVILPEDTSPDFYLKKLPSPKTACGIKLADVEAFGSESPCIATAQDGGKISVSAEGKYFDCKRCKRQLELRHDIDKRLRM